MTAPAARQALDLFGGGDELLLHIFSFLSFPDLRRIAPTCRRFALIANDESLWRSFCFDYLPTGSKSVDDARAPLVSSLFQSFISRHLEGGQCTWRRLFRSRFWIRPTKVQALALHRTYTRQKADTLSTFMEELLRPPYLLAAVVAHTASAGTSDGVASWLLDLVLHVGGLSLAGTQSPPSSAPKCFVTSMISAYIWIGGREQQGKSTGTDREKPAHKGTRPVVLAHFMSTETCSKLITRYFHLVGDAYLQDLLRSALTDIGKRRKKGRKSVRGNGEENIMLSHMSHDAVRFLSDICIITSRARVVEIAQDARTILERIVNNVDKMPPAIRRVCRHIHAEVVSAAPESNQGWHFVRLSLFYRFIFPSIVDSSQYDVFSEQVKGYDMRSYLVAVAKVLHSLCQQEEEVEKNEKEEAGAERGQIDGSEMMGRFIKRILSKEGAGSASVVTEEEEEAEDAETGTDDWATRARQGLELLCANVKQSRAARSLVERITEYSSPEYGRRIEALLQEIGGLEDLPQGYDDAKLKGYSGAYDRGKQRPCLLC